MIMWQESKTLLLEILRNYELYAKSSKCGFWPNEVVILEHIFGDSILWFSEKWKLLLNWE